MDRASTESGTSQQSYSELFSGLLKDVQDLVRGEVRLAKAEVKEDMASLVQAVVMLAAAAIFGIVGLTVLLIGVAALVNEWIEEEWQAFGLVGLATLLVAALVGMIGKSRMSGANLAPERTIDSLKEDKQWASQQIKSLRN